MTKKFLDFFVTKSLKKNSHLISNQLWDFFKQECQGQSGGGHYAFTTTVYPDIWVILGDVNQSGRPVYQNVAHEKLLE